MTFISLLTNKYVIVGVILLATISYILVLRADISAAESQNNLLIAKLEVSNASITALQSSINDQNTAIEVFKGAADAREKLNRNEIAKAKVESTNQKKRADTIMSKVIPKDATACESANQLFNEEIKNAK